MKVDLVLFNWGFIDEPPHPVWLSEIKHTIRPVVKSAQWVFLPKKWRRYSNIFLFLRENAVWVALPHCTREKYLAWCKESWFGKQ